MAHGSHSSKCTPDQLIRTLMHHKWTQGEIASALKTTQPTISRILSCQHRSPNYVLFEGLKELVNSLDQFQEVSTRSD